MQIKRKGVFLVIIGILILLSIIFIFKNQILEQSSPLIKDAKTCQVMKFVSTMVSAHNFGKDCLNVYLTSFKNNVSYMCKYLTLDKDKAICFGSSQTSFENRFICNNLSGKNKEICTLNLIKKIYHINSNELKGKNICENFSYSNLTILCSIYQSVIEENYSFCKLNGTYNPYCLLKFINFGSSNSEVGNLFCNEFFNTPEDIFGCLAYLQVKYVPINLSILTGGNKHLIFTYSIFTNGSYTYLLENKTILSEEQIASGRVTAYPFNSYICTRQFEDINDLYKYCVDYTLNYTDSNGVYSPILEHWTYYNGFEYGL
jgi:hypothetical protein